MGAGLVLAAFGAAHRLQLDHAPTRLFVYLAARAKDDDERPVCWTGRDDLASALGKTGSAGHRAVSRALADLTGLDLVKSTAAAPGRNARHFLRDGCGQPLRPPVDEGRSPSSIPATEDTHRPSNGGRSADERRTLSVQTEDTHRPAEEEQENKEEGKPPSRFCSKHPNGSNGIPCGACGDARRAAEAWRPPKRPRRPHVHSFDPVSGYCSGCETREDHAA